MRALPWILALAAAALTPAGAAAATGPWSPPRRLAPASAGPAPAVAVGGRDGRLAALFVTRSVRGDRLELRQGTQHGLGQAIVVDRARRGGLDSPAVAVTDLRTLTAWRRPGRGARVIGFASVSRSGVPNAPQSMTGSPTAYEPRFVTPSLLTWHIRRQGYVRTIASGRPLVTDRLPPGATFGAVLGVDADGTLTVAWPQAGRILAAQRPAGGTFGAPVVLSSGPGYARSPALATTVSGSVVVAWVQNAGDGNALLTAARPRGGAFGAPREVVAATAGAFSPRLVATSDGGVVASYLATGSRAGWGSRSGSPHALALGPDGTLVGTDLSLGAAGERARDAALAADAGAAWVAWTATAPGPDPVHVRRLAPGGILGRLQKVSGRDDVASTAPNLAMARSGRALLAYATRDGRMRYVTRDAGL